MPEPSAAAAAPTRPFITVKWAQTLDGRVAASDGTSQWITGAAARADVHARRAQHDGILVGTGTLLADDPTLTARDPDGHLFVPAAEQPVPIIVGHREIPASARVRKHPALAARGLSEPVRIAGDNLAADFAALAALGITRVFVEGGPAIASSLITAGLADELLVYVAPALLGGPRLATTDIGAQSIADITRLRITSSQTLGDDLLIVASLLPKEAP